MSSPRRFSVQRHIDNYNLHNGLGQVVPFVEYSVGRREGKYQPQKVPQFTRSKVPLLDKIYDKIEAEVENQIVKDIANRIYKRLSDDQTAFNNIDRLATAKISEKFLQNF
jgi:Holliday junction resolvasome RuvABC ATP-dependent DNA helicase subunit